MPEYIFGVGGKTAFDKVATAVLVVLILTGVYKTTQYIVNRELNACRVKRTIVIVGTNECKIKCNFYS